MDKTDNILIIIHMEALVITGPTTVGKTAVAIEVARQLDGELINGWVSPLYDALPISTCWGDIPDFMISRTHLFRILNPIEPPMLPDDYVSRVVQITKEILQKNHLPIIEGSDPLYFSGLVECTEAGLQIGPIVGLRWAEGINVEKKVRSRLNKMLKDGLVSEVEEAVRNGWRNSWVVWDNIIPYNIVQYIEGDVSLYEAIDRIVIEWVGYAYTHLRQLLEFPNVTWIEHDSNRLNDTVNQILRIMKFGR